MYGASLVSVLRYPHLHPRPRARGSQVCSLGRRQSHPPVVDTVEKQKYRLECSDWSNPGSNRGRLTWVSWVVVCYRQTEAETRHIPCYLRSEIPMPCFLRRSRSLRRSLRSACPWPPSWPHGRLIGHHVTGLGQVSISRGVDRGVQGLTLVPIHTTVSKVFLSVLPAGLHGSLSV